MKHFIILSLTLISTSAFAQRTEYTCDVTAVASNASADHFSDAYGVRAENCTPLNLAKMSVNGFTMTKQGAEIAAHAMQNHERVKITTAEPTAYGSDAVAIDGVAIAVPDHGEAKAQGVMLTSENPSAFFTQITGILDDNGVQKVPFVSKARSGNGSMQSYTRTLDLSFAELNAKLTIHELGEHYFRIAIHPAYVSVDFEFTQKVRGTRSVTLSASESAQVRKIFALGSNDKLVLSAPDSVTKQTGPLTISSQNSIVTIAL